jgi:putative oxidoreductase
MNRPPPAATFSTATVAATAQPASLERFAPYILSILRIMAGLLFWEHGLSKMFGFPPHGAMPHFPEMEFFAGCIESTVSILVVVGLFTRQAAFIVSGEMAIGYFLQHAPRSFFPLLNGGDAAVLYCFLFLYFVFAGPGPLSLDALLRWKRRSAGSEGPEIARRAQVPFKRGS